MEVLRDQIDIFALIGEEVTGEKMVTLEKPKKINKKKSEKNNELEVLEGQITAFELVETEEKEAISNFTDGQLKTIQKLKEEKEWIEYSLYESGKVLLKLLGVK